MNSELNFWNLKGEVKLRKEVLVGFETWKSQSKYSWSGGGG